MKAQLDSYEEGEDVTWLITLLTMLFLLTVAMMIFQNIDWFSEISKAIFGKRLPLG